MICYKHALGKKVAFRVRKFGFCFLGGVVCLFSFCVLQNKVALLMTCYHWLNKAEERNGCH